MRERERDKNDNGEEWSLSLPLSPVAGISIRRPMSELLWRRFQEGRQELGGVVSCGAGVRLVSKASYGTSTLKRYSRRQGPSPGPSHPINAFIPDHPLHH